MTIKEVHYDIKRKLNKVDSQQYKNLLIPEIDVAINEAIQIFIDIVTQPRGVQDFKGFEKTQKTIDDIRTLVVSDQKTDVSFVSGEDVFTPYYLLPYPGDYMYFTKGRLFASSDNCAKLPMTFKPREHDDEYMESAFDRPSFKWKMVNAIFSQDGIRIFTDNKFSVTTAFLSYIKVHPYVHNAEDFRAGGYKLPSGELLTGVQELILPNHTHREISDLAAMIISGDISAGNYVSKVEKLKINGLI